MLFLVLVFVLIATTVLFIALQRSRATIPDEGIALVEELWEQAEYLRVVEITGTRLLEHPLDPVFLLYNGLGNFYYGITLVDHDERDAHLNAALISLRKLNYDSPDAFQSSVNYALGKAYYYKGSHFFDLAEKYLLLAEDSAFDADDIYELLGVIYLETDRTSLGIEYLLSAIERDPRDILFLTIAQAYENTGSYDQAMEYFGTALRLSTDSYVQQQGLIGQARILIAQEEYDDAGSLLERVLEANTQSAEAYFYLGEISAARGDLAGARALWRKAYNQDRSFIPAIERLQS